MKKILLSLLLPVMTCVAYPAHAQQFSAGGGSLCRDEGGSAAACTTLNFTGAGVSSSTSAGVTTVTVGPGSPFTTVASLTDNVNPAVCGTIYIVNTTAKTLTLPSAPATGAACHVGVTVSISGYVTVAAGAGDTYVGNGIVTQSTPVTGILDLWYVQGSTTWYSQAGPPLQIWNANGSYAGGQIVADSGTPAKFCMSRVAGNVNNALTDTTKWICLGPGTVNLAYVSDYFKLEDNEGNCSGTGGSALGLNFATEGRKFFTITANCEITVTDPTSTAGEVVTVAMCWTQSGAGGFTLTVPANFRWNNATAPVWGTTAGDDNCAFCYYRQTSDEYVCSGVGDY